MNNSELTQSFIERCERNHTSVQELATHFQTSLERLGFRYFACCSHVDPLNPPETAVMLHNYPRSWERAFSEFKRHEHDPVLLHAERSLVEFSWDDKAFRSHLSKPQKDILEEGALLGLVHGYTIPIHLPRQWGALRASCSIVPDAGPISADSYSQAQRMARHLYHAASRRLGRQCVEGEEIALPLRERQCLELAAQGKTDKAIGRILGLSECTVHTYIERTKRRLGVDTRMQAVAEAITAKQISYGHVTATHD